MRLNKKEYYYKLLEQYRSDTQGTWQVLNSIIRKGMGKEGNQNYYARVTIQL